MYRLIRARSFWVGVFSAALLFLSLNLIELVRQTSKLCFDCDKGYGIRFRVYESGSVLHTKEILWNGVVASSFSIALISIIVGLAFYSVGAFISNRQKHR